MTGELFPPDVPALEAHAAVSADGLYRYSLTRSWGDGPAAVFIMLNPSTADGTQDDPTIRRCLGFARRLGCEAIEVVNLFAWRATDPDSLLAAQLAGNDIVGPVNDAEIATVLSNAAGGVRTVAWSPDMDPVAPQPGPGPGPVIAAWGAGPAGMRGPKAERVAQVLELARSAGAELTCLGTTAAEQPRHPLYLPANAPLTPWSPT